MSVRASLAALAVVVGTVFVVGCAQTSSPTSPSSSPTSPSSLVPSSAERTTVVSHTGSEFALQASTGLGPELAAVRRATAAFHDVANAVAAGYSTEGEPCVESPAGAMGVHAPNPALAASQSLDPNQPEVLLYLPESGGGLRLIGVEYVQAVLLRNPATGQVAPWFASGPWPSTYQVVTPTPQLFGETFQGPMPGHNPSMPWHWDLHVWVWAHNPAGMFAQWNAALHCGE